MIHKHDRRPLRSGLSWWVTIPLLVVLAFAGYCFVRWEIDYLRERQRLHALELANNAVTTRLAQAEQMLANEQFDQAIQTLNDALAIEGATEREPVLALLQLAKERQARALLDQAERAVKEQQGPRARDLLQQYLEHPQATALDEARRLVKELTWAMSEPHAVAVLRHMDDNTLTRFIDGEALAPPRELTLPLTQTYFAGQVREYLPRERMRREDRARHEKRIRSTPLYREVNEYLVQMRQQQQKKPPARRARSTALLQLLFRELGITSASEQRQYLEMLVERDPTVADQIAAQRTAFKTRVRALTQLDEAEREAFVELIDQLLDRLLGELTSHR